MQPLQTGAIYQRTMGASSDWRPIDTAPRDGTTIEVRCTYGVAPWFDLYHWTETPGTWACPTDGTPCRAQSGRWTKVSDENSSFDPSGSFTWRPYSGAAANYIDPTGGAQSSAAYWRGAVAAKYGLPLNTFEKDGVPDRVVPKQQSWWGRITKAFGAP